MIDQSLLLSGFDSEVLFGLSKTEVTDFCNICVFYQTLVFQINRCAETPHIRQCPTIVRHPQILQPELILI
jgi:hypothetical protein